MLKKLGFRLFIILLLIVGFIIINIGIDKSKGDYMSDNEYVRTIDIAPLIDQNSGKKIEISFEIKSDVPGKVLVYQNNGSANRYDFREYIDVSSSYENKIICVEPILVDGTIAEAFISFYGGYGTGVIPHIRDLHVSVLD